MQLVLIPASSPSSFALLQPSLDKLTQASRDVEIKSTSIKSKMREAQHDFGQKQPRLHTVSRDLKASVLPGYGPRLS